MLEVSLQSRTPLEAGIEKDRQLFAQFLEGDNSAFIEFFDRHNSRLGKYCRKMIGKEKETEDALQDLWEKVIRMREADQTTPPNPLGLLYWMARNLCLNMIRDRKQHTSLINLPESNHPSVEMQERSQLEELVLLALDQLPLSQREPLILHTYSGYSFEEIAEMMDQSVGAVRNRAWRGRRQLKRVISVLIELDENRQMEEGDEDQ